LNPPCPILDDALCFRRQGWVEPNADVQGIN
jgi:hypothetical protein